MNFIGDQQIGTLTGVGYAIIPVGQPGRGYMKYRRMGNQVDRPLNPTLQCKHMQCQREGMVVGHTW